jgi:hypothetical protein
MSIECLFFRGSKSVSDLEGSSMKKPLLSTFLLLFLTTSVVHAQDTSVNVDSFEARELSTVPRIDGDLSEPAWDNISEIPVSREGAGPGSLPAEAGDWDITMKAAWNEETNALYFGFHVIDDIYVKITGQGSIESPGSWQSESLELVINAENTGLEEDGEISPYHVQYVFEFPTTRIPSPAGVADIPVSMEFISMPVFEKIDGRFSPGPGSLYNLDDNYVQSAGRIRVTEDPGANATWGSGLSVEFFWEIKIVPMSQLGTLSFTEEASRVKELQPFDVIGIDPGFNDSDIFLPNRDHRVNLSGFPDSWNSSEHLVGMILMPSETRVRDWEVY